MKTKFFKIIISLFLLSGLSLSSVFAQLSTNETPLGLMRKASKLSEMVIEIKAPDSRQIQMEDRKNDDGGLQRVSVAIPVKLSSENDGSWEKTLNGLNVWRLTISVQDAQSLDFSFDEFWLPEGGKFFIYNPETQESIGAITNEFLQGDKKRPANFSTGMILGDKVTLEYFQPSEVKEKPIISISAVYYGYRFVNIYRNIGLDHCQVNINCSEGQNWQAEKEAVARIYVKTPTGAGWCSGALVNNTENNLTPLFLTADHCLDGVFDAESNSNLSQWVFYWHYEHPTCSNSSTEPPIYSTVGATVKANNSTTDFALLELTQDPRNLPNFTPYYLGWDRSGNAGTGGVGIHHPRGDVKKISIDYRSLTNYASVIEWQNKPPSQPNTHWKSVIDVGTQERGSSGSPILNYDRKIIGQLHGGMKGCAPITKFYGKFDVSWTGNGTSNNKRKLQPWLDPMGTGVAVLDGTFGFRISGSSLICSQATYTLDNLPTGATVQWSASNSNLQLISGQGTRSATFRKNGNGSTIIKVNVNGTEVLKKDVWVGVPQLYFRIGDNPIDMTYPLSGSMSLCYKESISYPKNRVFFEPKGLFHTFNTTWDYNSSSQNPFTLHKGAYNVTVIPTGGGGGFFSLRVDNECGWSLPIFITVITDACSGDNYYFLSPNGDGLNDTWEISLASKYLKDASLSSKQTVLKSLGYNVAIFNSQGAMVYQKENYMQDPERFSGVGNTGNYRGIALPDGTYFYTITGSIVNSGYIYLKR